MEREHERRLASLDGLRALAIALVIGFHYFARWTPPLNPVNLYPYGGRWAHVTLFAHGNLGVNVFFIISGFVISMTLERSAGLLNFAYKRFARLFPSMLLCSVVTFVVLRGLPQTVFHPHWRDFLPSLTFTEPVLWRRVTHLDFQSMDGAYWSLAVEVKFYLWIAVLYFGLRGRRFFVGLAVAFALLMGSLLGMRMFGLPHQWLLEDLFVTAFLPWFVAGVGFHALHRGSRVGWLLLLETLVTLLVPGFVVPALGAAGLVAFGGGCAFFLGLLYRPAWVALFAAPMVAAVGEASYSLYLLHQEIGVALLQLLDRSASLRVHPWVGASLATGVALGMAGLACLIYRYWEAPTKSWLLALAARYRARHEAQVMAVPAAAVDPTGPGGA